MKTLHNKKNIVAFSGGHSSAMVAIEVARKYGTDNLILLNHNITAQVELEDVKRFKKEIAEFIGVEITYANHPEWEVMTPLKYCVEKKSFVNPANRSILCTYGLKTKPFYDWLDANYQEGDVCYYGFDKDEQSRITRRSNIMGDAGYLTDYPLALWESRTIESSEEIGIAKPAQYDKFKHANCIGCLKAGWQHWYIIFCEYPNIWEDAKQAEEEIGYSVHRNAYFEDKEEMFEIMRQIGVEPSEKKPSGTFWAEAKDLIKQYENGVLNLSLFDMPDFEPSVECTGDCKLQALTAVFTSLSRWRGL